MKKKTLQYAKTGVNYKLMDPLKIMAQKEGRKTASNLLKDGFKEMEESRGESAYVIDMGYYYLASVMEGLGTKNLVADAMYKITGKTYYDIIAQDTVAAIINDLITVGAKPTTILAYWGAGDPSWFEDKKRMKDLVSGWSNACQLAGVTWGGGETPGLSGIIEKTTVDLAGACFGVVKPKKRIVLGDKLTIGDHIILFESNGIHANGLSLARKIASQLPSGYATKLSNGKSFGESLLQPTIIYSKLIQDLFAGNVDIHYLVNITGHGWRKIMRSNKKLTYKITKIPPVSPLFKFLMENGPVSEKEAYGNFNMGAGFAVFVSKKDADKVVKIAKKHKIKALIAGKVEKGPKQVIIKPRNIVFKGESLQVKG